MLSACSSPVGQHAFLFKGGNLQFKRITSTIRKLILTTMVSLIALISVSFGFSSIACAAGGNGSGGGSGGGNNPLTFSGAYLATVDGNASTTGASVESAKLPKQPTIKLVFSLNVVDNSVWPSPNQSAVTMVNSSGASMQVEVFRVDPSANLNEKENIFIKPVSALAAGERYSIAISPALTGNNGQTLGSSVTVLFVTEGTPAVSNKKSAGASTTSKSSTKAKPATSGNMSNGSLLIIFGAVVAIIIVAGGIYFKRRAKANLKSQA